MIGNRFIDEPELDEVQKRGQRKAIDPQLILLQTLCVSGVITI